MHARSTVKRIDKARKKEDSDPIPEEDDNEEEGVKLVGEAEAAMHDAHDIEDNACDHLDLEQQIGMLNEDQKHLFYKISEHLSHQHHDVGECKCKEFKALQMFISGVGGTGKLFLIETIRSQVIQIWKDDLAKDATCVVVAVPTGLAAFNIQGGTLNRLFQLPIDHKGRVLVVKRCTEDYAD